MLSKAKHIHIIFFVAILILGSYSPLSNKYVTRAQQTPLALQDWYSNATSPWALGVTVPDGSPLSDGSRLQWNRISNITVVLKLPNINRTDETIYAILSAMTTSQTVLQVAAGIYPGEDRWFTYVSYITDISIYPQHYMWVANRSLPEMKAKDMISLSIYSSTEGWMYMVQNLDSQYFKVGYIVDDGSTGFKNGEQEIITLESYTSNSEIFREMDAFTLSSIFVNGDQAVEGWYLLGGWEPVHKPLYIVGGGKVPNYISVEETSDRKVLWRYNLLTDVNYYPDLTIVRIVYILVVIFIIVFTGFLLWNRFKRRIKNCGELFLTIAS